MKIDSNYYYHGDEESGKLYYIILENGYEIYIGENAKYPTFRQTEPYIPNPDISYEENAKEHCLKLSYRPDMIDKQVADQAYASSSDVISIRSDLDYLMLLNDTTEE